MNQSTSTKVDEKIFRFNRYMVECEFLYCLLACHHCVVLIDTWWNVNTVNLQATGLRIYVLIDTWWNVNAFSLFLSFLR